jgi:5-methylcytosine-specific restriction enzyme subunit McrC
MDRLFERFVRRFYTREQTGLRVSARQLKWQEVERIHDPDGLLPGMRTDIVLEDQQRVIIIDTKFYRKTLAVDPRSGRKSIHSEHLYQLYSYVRNMALGDDGQREVEGLLLYPRVDQDVSLEYRMQGHRFRVETIDLDRPAYNPRPWIH